MVLPELCREGRTGRAIFGPRVRDCAAFHASVDHLIKRCTPIIEFTPYGALLSEHDNLRADLQPIVEINHIFVSHADTVR